MAQRYVFAQTDFGGGQVDEDAHLREDAKVMKTAARLMSNWRQRNTGTLQVRPGRNAFSLTTAPRCERFRMSANQELILSFGTSAGNGAVAILDRLGNVIASNISANYLWTNSTLNLINWTLTPDRVVICYPGMQPQLILWNEATNVFSFQPFVFATLGFQVNEPFFRLGARGATMKPSALTGTITLTCSVPFFTNSMIGQRLSLGGAQVTITAVGSATPITTCTAVVDTNNSLNAWVSVSVGFNTALNPLAIYPANTLAETAIDKITIETGTAPANLGGNSWNIFGTVLTGIFVSGINTVNNQLVTAYGSAGIGQFGFITTPQPIITWQQEFMNAANGWPASCFFVQGRLGFCDFPQRPDAVLMSASGLYDIFFVDSAAAINNPNAGVNADSSILVFISGQPHVRNVVEWNGDIFVFTDQGVYRIPTTGTAVTPGTISFQKITDATASTVKPLVTKEAVIFTSASSDRVSSIVRTGNFTTPYVEQDLTIFHSQLIKTPVTIAVGHGDDGFPERYIYVLNSDGTVVVGRVQDDRSFVGWLPWSGAGSVSWISSALFDVLFTTLYGTQYVLEYENVSFFLDQTVNYNSPPANMLFFGGPFIAFANGQVRVMDGAIDYGFRNVDATGHLIKNPEDDFSSPTIVAGAPFTSQFKPFLEEAQRGQAVGQRQRLRKITRAIVSVYGSSGFTFGGRTIPPFNFGDNPFAQPKLKETSYTARFLGRAFDPQVLLLKDAPGPLTIVEFVQEATV